MRFYENLFTEEDLSDREHERYKELRDLNKTDREKLPIDLRNRLDRVLCFHYAQDYQFEERIARFMELVDDTIVAWVIAGEDPSRANKMWFDLKIH